MLAQAERSPATQKSSPTPWWRLAAPMVMGLGLLAGSKENSAASEVPGVVARSLVGSDDSLAGLIVPQVSATITSSSDYVLRRRVREAQEQAAREAAAADAKQDASASNPVSVALAAAGRLCLKLAAGAAGWFVGMFAVRSFMDEVIRKTNRRVASLLDRAVDFERGVSKQGSRNFEGKYTQVSETTKLGFWGRFRALSGGLSVLMACAELAQTSAPASSPEVERNRQYIIRSSHEGVAAAKAEIGKLARQIPAALGLLASLLVGGSSPNLSLISGIAAITLFLKFMPLFTEELLELHAEQGKPAAAAKLREHLKARSKPTGDGADINE